MALWTRFLQGNIQPDAAQEHYERAIARGLSQKRLVETNGTILVNDPVL